MRSLTVVEGEVLRQAQRQLGDRAVAFQVDVLVLDAAPEPLHKNIVECPTASVHTDRDARALEYTCEGFARKLRTLIRSEEQTSELQSLMRIAYAVFCLKQKKENGK